MIVKHIGTDGRLRRTFEGVYAMQQHSGDSSVIVLSKKEIHVDTNKVTGWMDFVYPTAFINLAPGESVERDDEPARS